MSPLWTAEILSDKPPILFTGGNKLKGSIVKEHVISYSFSLLEFVCRHSSSI
jgi:hypothetical protein